MTQRKASLFTAVLLLLTAAPLFAASPRLTTILPRGIQRGQEHVVTFSGRNLGDAQEIFFYDQGFEVTKLEPNGNTVKATFKVSAECRLGEHVAQVRTASGISDYRTFFVEAFPAVEEKEPNSDFETPQEVALNSAVNGIVQSEDVDYFVVEAKKGQRISAEVIAMRLGDTLFDPYVAILDGMRFELSASDDTALALQDCFASVVAPADGKYVIEVRESAYGGGNSNRYRLQLGSFPRPSAAFPAGGKLGEETEVRFLGVPAGELVQKFTLPSQPVTDFGVYAADDGGVAPTPNAFRLFEHGNAFEVEPNDSTGTATPVELPLAFNGIIEKDEDVDCFKFAAKKGQVYEVECYARRVRSGLDPVMNLYYADGRSVAGNDDSRGPDSYIRWTVPADGDYVVRITDHLKKGRPDFVYRVEFQPVSPTLTLGIPRQERYGQYRQQIYVARGNRVGAVLTANRSNFSGDLALEGKDLPAGITLRAEPMPSNLNSMPIVFEAAADAPLGGAVIDFTARHVDESKNIRGGFFNRADFVVANPGQSLYTWKDVDRLAIAVVEELPFELEIVEPKVPLVRDGSMQLKIVAHRKEGFTAAIKVEFPFRPPGVSAGSSVTIPAGKNEVLYPLNASGNAQISQWKIFALGSADVSGTAWVSSQLANLEVADQRVTFEMQRTACEQGQEARILCKVNQVTPFEGNAKAQILGLPPKVKTTDLEFNKETQELIFSMQTEPDSPVGKHNLLCNVTVTQNGEVIVSRVGTVQFQIDKPLPAPVTQPKPEAKPEPKPEPEPKAVAETKPEPPKEKPLSRLEKLRLAAQQRKEAMQAEASGGE